MSVFRCSLPATIITVALGVVSAAPAQPPQFFADRDMMTVGVYYYPEAWPRAQWERDFANIRKHGFEFVHMAEFAWAFMEPEDGRFEFEWLETAVRLAAAQAPVIEYYHVDALGSVRAVTDATGAVVRTHTYHPFGEGVGVESG